MPHVTLSLLRYYYTLTARESMYKFNYQVSHLGKRNLNVTWIAQIVLVLPGVRIRPFSWDSEVVHNTALHYGA